jgi:hypothetical protein
MRDQLLASIALWTARRETAIARHEHAGDMIRAAVERLRELDGAEADAVLNLQTMTFQNRPKLTTQLRPTPVSITTEVHQTTGTDA